MVDSDEDQIRKAKFWPRCTEEMKIVVVENEMASEDMGEVFVRERERGLRT